MGSSGKLKLGAGESVDTGYIFDGLFFRRNRSFSINHARMGNASEFLEVLRVYIIMIIN